MLKRFLVALPLVLLALVLVDRVSLFFAPCIVEKGDHADKQDHGNKETCAEHEGIVIAGLETLKEIPAEWFTAVASVAIALFTFTLWRSTDRLWKAGERQLRVMRLSTSANILAARSTRDAIKQAGRTAEQELRAYIGIVGGAILVTMQNDIQIQFDAKNQGQTPAREVQFFMNAEIRDGGASARTPGPIKSKFKSKWAIAPGAMWTLRFPFVESTKPGQRAFQIEDVGAVDRGEKELVVWGELPYQDVFFPDTPERKTTFCYRRGGMIFVPEDKRGIRPIKKAWEPIPCPEGNDAT